MEDYAFHGGCAGGHVDYVLRYRLVGIQHREITGDIIDHELLLPVLNKSTSAVVH